MPKNEHPAFLFYVDDFSSDGKVESMTTEEVGAYILLLCKAWRENPVGTIPNDDRVLARWARLNPDRWCECKPSVLAAFTLCADNRWHQKRMRQEYARLQQKHKERVERARKGAEALHSKRKEVNELRATSMPEAEHKHHVSMPRAIENENDLEFSLVPVSVSVIPENTEEQKLNSLVAALRARHPAKRTCGPAEIRKQLKAILRLLPKLRTEYPGVSSKAELLDLIDRNHALRCQTARWQEEGGAFAKGLDNWLAPTEKRYMDPPTDAELSAPIGGGKQLKSNMDNVARLLAAQKEMGWS